MGYLIPGASLLAGTVTLEWIAKHQVPESVGLRTPVLSALEPLLKFESNVWLRDGFVIVLIVLASYVLGHLVAGASAIFVDRLYVKRGYGYPLQHYLGLDKPSEAVTCTRNFYRALMFWFNLYLVVGYLALPGSLPDKIVPDSLAEVLPKSSFSQQNFKIAASIVGWILLGIVVTGLLLDQLRSGKGGRVAGSSTREAEEFRSELAKRLRLYVEKLRSKLANLPWPNVEGLRSTLADLLRLLYIILAWLLKITAKPSRTITSAIGGASGTLKALDDATIQAFTKRMNDHLKRHPDGDHESTDSSRYWYAYIAVLREDPKAVPLLDNWLRLYSFARNLSTATYGVALYGVFWWLAENRKLATANEDVLQAIQATPLLFLIAAVLLLQRYHYLYCDYYTKFLIRAFAFPPKSSRTESAAEAGTA